MFTISFIFRTRWLCLLKPPKYIGGGSSYISSPPISLLHLLNLSYPPPISLYNMIFRYIISYLALHGNDFLLTFMALGLTLLISH